LVRLHERDTARWSISNSLNRSSDSRNIGPGTTPPPRRRAAGPGSGLSGHNGCQACTSSSWSATCANSRVGADELAFRAIRRRCDRSSASCYDPSGVRRGLGRRRGQRAQGAVGLDARDRRLERSRSLSATKDLLADEPGARPPPAARGHRARRHGRARRSNQRRPRGTFPRCSWYLSASSPVVLRGSKARSTAVKTVPRLTRSELRLLLSASRSRPPGRVGQTITSTCRSDSGRRSGHRRHRWPPVAPERTQVTDPGQSVPGPSRAAHDDLSLGSPLATAKHETVSAPDVARQAR